MWNAWNRPRMLNRKPARLLLAFAAGAVAVLAFAPFGQGWIALLSLALLFTLWRGSTPGESFFLGWSWGLGLMGFGVFWLHNSITQFGGVNLPLAIFITLLFATGLALFYGLAGWLANRFPARARLLLVYPAVWALAEWLRSWLFTGFTWLSLGYAQIDTPLAGYAPLLGVYGIGLLLALSAAALVRWRSPWLALLPLIWLGGWLLQQVSWSKPAGKPFRATLVQGNIPQQLKWKGSQFRPTLELYLKLTDTPRKKGADADQAAGSRLVIWPETAVPAYAHEVEESFLQPLHEHFTREQRDLLLGIPVRTDRQHYYNAMLSLGASGRGDYFKRHLVPFGEFMPFSTLLKPLMDRLAIPMSEFSRGDGGKPLLRLAGHHAGISICYEDTFGGEVANALPEAAFLVNASNDAWFGDSLAPHQHLEMARMRALETGRYLLRATNTGISAIIDHGGKVITLLPQFETGVVDGQVTPRQGMTPYARWPDWPLVIISLVLLGMAFYRRGAGGAPSKP